MHQLSGALVLVSSVLVVYRDKLSAQKQLGAHEWKVGRTTRYWDCCKPSCSWPGEAELSKGPVRYCHANNHEFHDDGRAQSGCEKGGVAFMCASQQPWQINPNLAYGFAATHITGQSEADWCCSCYEFALPGGKAKGKKLIVQVTNTGGDLGENHFDVAIPGGGLGLFDGCSSQYHSNASNWGIPGGTVINREQCEMWPKPLRSGCDWLWDWYDDNNPDMTFRRVRCPKEITDETGCIRADEETFDTLVGR